MRSIVLILISLLACCTLINAQVTRNLERERTAPLNTDARTALVIGNGKYADVPLRNPPNDAADMAVVLRSLGFEVFSYTDLDQNGMKRVIREFGAKLRTKGGVGLFYYAGHGVQSKGVNYLIPISAKVDTEEEVEYESVDAGLVLAQMESAKNGMNIVILDACRNNPFARSFRSAQKGLASIDAPSGTLLAYSTAPGSVAGDGAGRNGIYTQELLKQIRTPGLSLEDVFKQVRISVRSATAEKQTPWESSSLTGDFYFGQMSTRPGSIVNQKTSLPFEINHSVEEEYWNNIKNSDDRKDFEKYLSEYPSGKFTSLARQKLDKLEAVDSEGLTAKDRVKRGDAAAAKGNFSQAFEEITKAIEFAPDYAYAYFDRGSIYLFIRKDYVAAIADFDKAISLDPNYFGAYNGRGLAFHNSKQYEKAISDFSKSLELKPKWSHTYSFRADSYEKLGDKARAAADRTKFNEIKHGQK